MTFGRRRDAGGGRGACRVDISRRAAPGALSRPCDPLRRRLPAGRAGRPFRAHAGAEPERGPGPAGGGREQVGRRRQHRLPGRGRGQARRLHAAGRHLDHEHRAGDVRQAALRPADQPCSRRAFHHHPHDHRGAGRGPEDDRGAGGADRQRTRQAFLRLARQRQPDTHGQPAVRAARRRRGAARALSRLGAGHAGHAGRPTCLPDRHAWAAARASSMPGGCASWPSARTNAWPRCPTCRR